MAKKSLSKSSDGTIFVRAAQGEAFKKCCMQSGAFDGSRRNYFFQRVVNEKGAA
jgi:hypothetical protein